MVWDTEGTKARLLAAATAEFSGRGLAGARVDRIAASAGVNKERIYQYFGKKEELFDAVLVAALARTAAEVPITGIGPEAVGSYAGRLFDHHAEGAVLLRLLLWSDLERGDHVVQRACGAEKAAAEVERLMVALPGVTRADVADLLLTIITLCDGWQAMRQLDALLVRETSERFARRRAFIVRTVTLMAEFLEQDGQCGGSSSRPLGAVGR